MHHDDYDSHRIGFQASPAPRRVQKRKAWWARNWYFVVGFTIIALCVLGAFTA